MVFTVSKEFQKESVFLVALDENTGTLVWFTELENVPNIFSPVVYDEKIYITFGNTLGIFNAETGEKIMEKTFDADHLFTYGRNTDGNRRWEACQRDQD